MTETIRLRPAQKNILAYQGGQMGIAAVPGAGKTFTLSLLAARLITSGLVGPGQEVLIVTLTNSAVDNFAARISAQLSRHGLISTLGYRVRTLHGLAHDIVREKPALAGLSEGFSIVDEREAAAIRRSIIQVQLQSSRHLFETYLNPDLNENSRARVWREQLPKLADDMVTAFISTAKDRRLTPQRLSERLQAVGQPLPLAAFCLNAYAAYQDALQYRGAVDFDDLMRLALNILEQDPDYLERLQTRWPFVLEDEAQDSSRLQEDMLRLLTRKHSNWVRVGDPNQAIYETFTTANPVYLRQFIAAEDTLAHPLPQSGRSQPWIIALANRLVEWTMQEHPAAAVRDALYAPPWIEPAPPNDPQPNPPADPDGIKLIGKLYTPPQEIDAIVRSLKKWLPKHPDQTVAILVPTNKRGADFAQALQKAGLPYSELLSTTDQTRRTAGALTKILRYLADPRSARKLSEAYRVLRRDWREDKERKPLLEKTSDLLKNCPRLEDYLAPLPDADWIASLEDLDESTRQELQNFRLVMQRWQQATLLPIDQLILTLGQELFTRPAELALTHKLALLLKSVQNDHPSYRLPELAAELQAIARNERKFLGFSGDDTGFDPEKHRGEVLITTAHRAKGLEWDRVYLTSVSNYDYPSLEKDEYYIFENWFIRDGLNLQAETLAQLHWLLPENASTAFQAYEEGAASLTAREDYIRERLRLFYVGITRARRELIITANSGRHGKNTAALPLRMLIAWWQNQSGETA